MWYFLAITALSLQWSCPAHAIIAAVAFNDLGIKYADEKIAPLLNNEDFDYTQYKCIYEYACWADDVKNKYTAPWHYYSIPFYDSYCPPFDVPRTKNVAFMINLAKHVLKGEDTSYSKSLMIRFLIHFMGDIHQPLHVASRYSTQLPKGDKGGNLFKLKKMNLHKLWDHALGYLSKYHRPMTKSNIEFTETLANILMEEFPRSIFSKELKTKDGFEIAQEIHLYAEGIVYQDIIEGSIPSNSYLEDGYKLCRRLMALAGYRLSDALYESFRE